MENVFNIDTLLHRTPYFTCSIYIYIYDACTFIIDATLQIYPLDSPSAGLYGSCTTITDANLQVPSFDSPSAGL